jgi:hypothetical protein
MFIDAIQRVEGAIGMPYILALQGIKQVLIIGSFCPCSGVVDHPKAAGSAAAL